MNFKPINRTLFSVLASSLTFCTSAPAQAPSADVAGVLANSAAAYRNIKTVSYVMDTTAFDPKSHKSETISVHVLISKPNLLNADLTGKQGHVHVVADGKSIYSTAVKESHRYLKVADKGFSSVIDILKGSGGCGIGIVSMLFTDPAADKKMAASGKQTLKRGANASIAGTPCDVIVAQSTDPAHPVSFTFAFAKSDHLLRKVTVVDPHSSSTPLFTELYSNIKLNQPAPAQAFRFTPPAGATAVDPTVPPPPYDVRVKVGASPLPIKGTDLSGKPVSLAEYRGKVLLVDFWATWCGPCIQEMPNVIAAYSRYHPRGFEIVGVTLDQANAKQKVQQFVAANRMPWRQIYDGKYWSAANASAYGLTSIPFSILIGRDGKIAAVAPRGPALAPAVEAALNRK